MMNDFKVLALTGGVGGAKLSLGLYQTLPPEVLTLLINTGDDQQHYGLLVCPDIDTVIYTLSGKNNQQLGWGIEGESWHCLNQLKTLGVDAWFQLGDKDIATHLFRLDGLNKGLNLTAVTDRLAKAHNLDCKILPMTDSPVRTQVDALHEGHLQRLGFHEYFVKFQCEPEVKSIHFQGSEAASLSDQANQSIKEADALIVCPSNPYLSIDPIFSVPSLKALLKEHIEKRLVVSPIIGGQAIKGPTAKIMQELGIERSVLSVAQHYQGFATHFVIDHEDEAYKDEIEALGLSVLLTQTLMKTDEDKRQLARDCLGFLG